MLRRPLSPPRHAHARRTALLSRRPWASRRRGVLQAHLRPWRFGCVCCYGKRTMAACWSEIRISKNENVMICRCEWASKKMRSGCAWRCQVFRMCKRASTSPCREHEGAAVFVHKYIYRVSQLLDIVFWMLEPNWTLSSRRSPTAARLCKHAVLRRYRHGTQISGDHRLLQYSL
jgi:hypothetical protein